MSTDPGVSSKRITEDDVTTASTDFFTFPSYEVGLGDSIERSYRPENLSGNGPIRIDIPESGFSFLQMNNARLYMLLQVVKADGSDAEETDNYSIVNNVVDSLFQSIHICIDGVQISELTQEYHMYKSYLEKKLSYGLDAISTHLSGGLYTTDTAGAYDSFKILATDTGKNAGYLSRRAICKASQKFDIFAPICIDFLQSDRYLPPGKKLSLIFNRTNDTFPILSPHESDKFKIKIHDMAIYINHIMPTPEMQLALEKKLISSTPGITYKKTKIYTKQFAKGMTNADVYGCIEGIMPKTIILGMVETEAFDGAQNLNPFNFQHFNANDVSLKINNAIFPQEPYRPNFSDGLFMREYISLFDNIGINQLDFGLDLNVSQFTGGSTFFAFDLTPDHCNGYHLHKQKTGVIDVNVKFKSALAKGITLLVISSYDNVLLWKDQKDIIVKTI